MGKNPAFQWYPNDYLRDTRILSLPARGAWADFLNYMWYAPERGMITGTTEQIARMLSCSIDEIELVLNELNVTKVADVTNCNGIVTVINRRMHREERERKSTRLRVQKFRNAKNVTPCNENITPPSSTSSSITKNIYMSETDFNVFYDKYPRHEGKAPALRAWKKIKKDNGLFDNIITAVENQKQYKYDKTEKKYIPLPATWLNEERWNDEIEVKKSSW